MSLFFYTSLLFYCPMRPCETVSLGCYLGCYLFSLVCGTAGALYLLWLAVPPMACCTSYGLLYLLWVAVGGAAPSPHHTHVSVSPLSGTAGALYLLWHAVPPMSCCRRCGALAAPAASLSFSFEWYSEGAVPPMSSQAGSRTPHGLWVVVDYSPPLAAVTTFTIL